MRTEDTTFVIHGREATGKTTNAWRLGQYFKRRVIDDWVPGDPIISNTLILSRLPIDDPRVENITIEAALAMMDSKIYVLKMDYADPAQTQGGPTRVRLIGPFTTNDAAVHWAGYREAPDINPNNPADNPCWQIVLLDNPTVHLEAP